jgi:cell division protein FtsW
MIRYAAQTRSAPQRSIFEQSLGLERPERPADRILLFCFMLMMLLGTLAVFSALAFFAREKGTTAVAMMQGHLPKLGIGMAVMLLFSRLDYRLIVQASRFVLIGALVLLLIVNQAGDVVFGARRSLSLAGFSFQPSSIASGALLLHLSGLLASKQSYIENFRKAFLPAMVWVVSTCALIGLQDFSSALLLFGLSLVVMAVARIPGTHFIPILGLGLLGAFFMLTSSPERMSRVQEYTRQIVTLPSETFEKGEGYQAQQAQIAIARGGVLGVGMGKSTQREFLPAPYNDFLYAIIAEEYGAVGAFGVLGLLVTVMVRGILVVARRAADLTGVLTALAATLMISIQGLIHMGVSIGLLPVTGLPLPLMSYGGSHLIVMGMMAGVLLSVSRRLTPRSQPFYVG